MCAFSPVAIVLSFIIRMERLPLTIRICCQLVRINVSQVGIKMKTTLMNP